jgi:hypothetical protein
MRYAQPKLKKERLKIFRLRILTFIHTPIKLCQDGSEQMQDGSLPRPTQDPRVGPTGLKWLRSRGKEKANDELVARLHEIS